MTESTAVAYGRETGALLVARELPDYDEDVEERYLEKLDELHHQLSADEEAAVERAFASGGPEARSILKQILDAYHEAPYIVDALREGGALHRAFLRAARFLNER